jgi:NAD(P)-dependent dehydrogenase (short-subunit alcohol dehydrogenase family)/GNAT superfamily N-acetyltransferase
MDIRAAERQDLDSLADIWHEGWHAGHAGLVPDALARLRTRESFRDRLEAALPHIRVAGPPGAPVGFSVVQGDELYQLYVAARWRGTGVAVLLIDDAEAQLARAGVGTAWLACAIGNKRAARFYEKRGWRLVGTIPYQADTENGPFPLEVWRFEKVLDRAAVRIALVTGAAGGIGSALLQAFRGAGYRAIGVDRSPVDGVTPLDVTDMAAVGAFAATLETLTVLVNAAGVLRLGEEYDPAEFARVIDVNLTGTLRMSLGCKAALTKGKGAIVNVASMHAIFGAPLSPAYAASKAGVVQLTKSLAVAWADAGIRVNAIAPGWIETPMTVPARSDASRNRAILDRTPLGRWGTPDDLVGPTLFLASDAARFVTGAVLPVDGGYSVK